MKMIQWGPVSHLPFLPRLFPMGCTLVKEDDGLTLIDACMPPMAKAIAKAISRTGLPLARIVLTHAHGDHIGAVPALKKLYPDAAIGISRRDALLLKGDRGLLPGEPQSPVRGDVPKQAPFAPDFLIEDGDRIGSLVAIAASGHTPGHMAFMETRTNTIIVGDAFSTKGGIAVSGHMKLSFPFPALATWHGPTAIESARKLAALQPARLVVGHGSHVEHPVTAMNDAIAAAERYWQKKAAL
ncbi:MBL fold metallo-hydrolase [Cohnella panacarvi]|uniref:MBL fold metallo-hydrolase n=1 Tax=Cohnella panacarvi TaxID=400776 RepID=UPI0004788133|nr:MBL fold metallo-hydrolase [Cohnella panacarvi]